jgi:hypothetical protein
MDRRNIFTIIVVVFAVIAVVATRHAAAQTKVTLESRVEKLESLSTNLKDRLAAAEGDLAKMKEVLTVGTNKNLNIDAQNVTLKASGTLRLESASTTTVKGSVIHLN